MSDDEIVKKLKKAKWKAEQITYALKKYKGKRTGMYELSIFNIFKGKKKDKKAPPFRRQFTPNRGFPRGRPI